MTADILALVLLTALAITGTQYAACYAVEQSLDAYRQWRAR